MENHQKKIAYSCMAIGLIVLGLVALSSRAWLVETWYLYRLEHGEETERKAVAEHLGEMGSVRAVPGLFEALREAAPEGGTRSVLFTGNGFTANGFTANGKVLFSGSLRSGRQVWWTGIRGEPAWSACTCSPVTPMYVWYDPPYFNALRKIVRLRRQLAVPHLINALEGSARKDLLLVAAGLLGRLDQAAEPAIAALEALSQSPDEDLRHVARDALRDIRGVEASTTATQFPCPLPQSGDDGMRRRQWRN